MPRKAKESKIIEDVEKIEIDKKVTSSKVKESKKSSSEKSIITKSKSKATAKKDNSKKVTTKKSSTNKKSADKKDSSSKSKAKTTAKSATKKATTKKTTSRAKAKTSSIKKRSISGKKVKSFKLYDYNKFIPSTLEYYDLPYKYNKTVVKALAQNPIVHNLTDKYSYELDINDFANNWYIHVNDSKCQYVIELGRKPIEYTEEVPTEYIYVTSSNVIEAPNDHVLFFNKNDEIYFKNIHTNKYTKRVIKPFLKHIYGIYENLNLTEEINSFDFKNPSSQNPSSSVL